MPNDYTAKIKTARDSGYSDDEIVSFIAKTDQKMAEAVGAGYSGSEILSHLEQPKPDVTKDPAAYAQGQASSVGKQLMSREFKKQLAGMPPQERYVASLPQGQQKAAGERIQSGMSMDVPETMLTLGTLSPVAAVEKLGVKGALRTVGKTALRGAAGTLAGEEAGRYVGRPAGRLLGNEAAGETVGSVVGALAGGTAALSNPGYMSRLPFGAGRMLMSDEEYATAVATRKLAQRKADITAGLRKPPVDALSASIETPRIVNASDPAARMVGNEGRAATWTNERVQEMITARDTPMADRRIAVQQAVRRGMKLPANARYLAGDPSYSSGVYNPRDVTRFSPEGTPIQHGGKRLSVVQEPATTPANKFAATDTPQVDRIATEDRMAKLEDAAAGKPGYTGAERRVARRLLDTVYKGVERRR